MSKRKRPETENEVIEWFENLRKDKFMSGYDDSQWGKIIQSVADNFINGDHLLSLTPENLSSLGVTLIGPQKTILGKIEEIKRSIRPEEEMGSGSSGGGSDSSSGVFKLSSIWKDGKKFCGSVGSKWEFQNPTDWVDKINLSNKFQVHFENWQKGEKDKQGHCFWFIAGGPGCGKSRCLDEFPGILKNAATKIENSAELQSRLQNMCVFKISFENGTKSRVGIPDASLIPALMAHQLQESSLSWTAFIRTAAAQNMTVDIIFEHLLKICKIANVKDLTILLLIDSLQESGSALESVVSMICDLVNCSLPFIMIACTATIQTTVREFLRTSGQFFVSLSPPPISEPAEITRLYESFCSYDARLMAKIMIQDMGGHGRALEYLLETLRVHNLDSVSANNVMIEVKVKLKNAYIGWNPLPAQDQVTGLLSSIICRARLQLSDVIPGTTVTVDRILQAGLFRYDMSAEILSVAYIWILLMGDRIVLPELQAIINLDYDKIKGKIEHGTSSSLSSEAFEEFWCYFRAIRSRCYTDKSDLEWSQFHSGAIVTKGCNIKFENNHLSLARAAHQFGTKSSWNGVIQLLDGTDWASRDFLLDKLILNSSGAPSGDSMVVLKLSNGEICTEAHECKRFDASALTTVAVRKEREKAADPTDYFVLICSEMVGRQLDQLPERTAIVDSDCFEQYFGPFAGRAFIYKHSGPLDVNAASVFQLQQCVGIGHATAKKIDVERRQKLFSGAEDFKSRIRSYSDAIMEQFCFSSASDGLEFP